MKSSIFVFFVILACALCADLDGDGFDSDPAFGRYQDCCDSVLDGCFDPYMVNPGAYEIPNNGLLDRCTADCTENAIRCETLDEENLPCDYLHIADEIYDLSGTDATADITENAVFALDICEFKDDDDDPSWGFYRQRNMVFALADQTREGFDIGVTGPNELQAAVLRSFGRLGPKNGAYMLGISSGVAKASYQPQPNNIGTSEGTSYSTGDDTVNLPDGWVNNPGPGTIYGTQKPTQAIDSILSRFAVVHPSNMGAFSVKALYMDREENANDFLQTTPSSFAVQSYFLAFKNGTYGVPSDGNFAIDNSENAFRSFNPNIEFFTQCGIYSGSWPDNTCPLSDIRLEGTNYAFASAWIPIGTAAAPGETYQLQFMTFDIGDSQLDVTVLLDDFRVMSEYRGSHEVPGYITVPYGYQYTGDIAMVSLLPDIIGLYPANTQSVTLTFVVRAEGPEISGDVTISFTPPYGTAYTSIAPFTSCTTFPAAAPFEDNSFYKCKLPGNEPLLPHQTITGSIIYEIKDFAPKDIQFRVTATTSSIDTVWGNNHLLQIIYIDK